MRHSPKASEGNDTNLEVVDRQVGTNLAGPCKNPARPAGATGRRSRGAGLDLPQLGESAARYSPPHPPG